MQDTIQAAVEHSGFAYVPSYLPSLTTLEAAETIGVPVTLQKCGRLCPEPSLVPFVRHPAVDGTDAVYVTDQMRVGETDRCRQVCSIKQRQMVFRSKKIVLPSTVAQTWAMPPSTNRSIPVT
jgi:hypothetical protein